MILRRKNQVEASKVIKGEINFELKADNIIIHAPVDAPKHLTYIFEMLPDGTNKTAYGRKKRPGYSGKCNMTDRNGWSFCSRVRLCRFSPSER